MKKLLFAFLTVFLFIMSSNALISAEGANASGTGNIIEAVRMLVPYDNFSKLLSENAGKMIVLPLNKFEEMVKMKEQELNQPSKVGETESPVKIRFNKTIADGKIEGNFAFIDCEISFEKFGDDWQSIDIFSGSILVSSATFDNHEARLFPNLAGSQQRTLQFSDTLNSSGSFSNRNKSNFLTQNLWNETTYYLGTKEKGTHLLKASIIVPIENKNDQFSMKVQFPKTPVSFINLSFPGVRPAIEDCSLKDYSINESADEETGSVFTGWLGGKGTLSLAWRKKIRPVMVQPTTTQTEVSPKSPLQSASSTLRIFDPDKVRPPIQPMVFAKSETLVSLGENIVQARTDFEFGISKAPVSRFEFQIPEEMEILSISADKAENHETLRDGKTRKIIVDFSTPREEKALISIVFECKAEIDTGLCDIPEIIPLGVVRELGTIAIQALTSVEVQAVENLPTEGTKLFRIETGELSDNLKSRSVRPLLLAYRHSARPINLSINLKKYADLTLQTISADHIDTKTVFTTNQTSNSLMVMKIRNNNKQYLTFQLPPKAVFSSAFINSRHVVPVEGKSDGKILIPLPMSKSIGSTENIELKVYYKQPVATMSWRGNVDFVSPIVDVPVTRSTWTVFAPEKYTMFNFTGNMSQSKPAGDSFIFRGFLSIYNYLYYIFNNPEFFIFLAFCATIAFFIFFKDHFLRLINFLFSSIVAIFRFLFIGAASHFINIMIIVSIIGILAAIAVPNFRKAREQAREKACYANMRVLLGAVEMYNMDNASMIKTSLDDVTGPSGSNLLKGYLKGRINKPETGCYYTIYNDITQPDGRIFCKLHGTVESDTPNEQDIIAGNAPSFSGQYAAKTAQPENKPGQNTSTGDKFAGGKSRGAQPLEDKLVLTPNYNQLERDLVIADTASSSLASNLTCPTIHFSYVRNELYLIARILSILLGFSAGIFFIGGCHFKSASKFVLSALIIVCLSFIDASFEEIGDFANLGLWIAIIAGIIWKIVQTLSQLDGSDSENSNQNTSGKATAVIILAALLFSGSQPVSAAGTAKEIKVFVPFSELSKALEEDQKYIVLPYDDYSFLKTVSAPQPVVTATAPFSFLLTKAEYHGKEEEKGVRFKGKFRFELMNDGWKSIACLRESVVPFESFLDGKPSSLDLMQNGAEKFYGLVTNATGTHELEVGFFLPFSAKDLFLRRLTLETFPFTINSLTIETLQNGCVGTIDPGLLEIKDSASKTILKAEFPPTELVMIEFFSRSAVHPPEPQQNVAPPVEVTPAAASKTIQIEKEETKISVSENNLFSFEEGFRKGINNYSVSVSGGSGIASFDLMIPQKITVRNVEGKHVENWRCDEEPGKKMLRLKIDLNSRIKGQFDFTVEFDEAFSEFSEGEYEIPELIPVLADRALGMLGIGSIKNFNLSVVGGDALKGYNPIDVSEFIKNLKSPHPDKIPLAFKFIRHPNSLKIGLSRPKDIEVQTALVDSEEAVTYVSEDGYIIYNVAFELRNNSEQFLKLEMPVFKGIKSELWSCEVAGQPVKAGADSESGLVHIPIIKSPIINEEPKPFPVDIVFTAKLSSPIQPMSMLPLGLPRVHLPVSKLSWVVFLPESYELMRGNGNVDISLQRPSLEIIEGKKQFPGISPALINPSLQANEFNQENRIFGMYGLLPVKFLLPSSSYWTFFTMSQIEPDKPAPYFEGMLISPKKGKGLYFNYLMIILGCIAGFAALSLIRMRKAWLSITVLTVLSCILATAVLMKIYQADHSFGKGFLMIFIGGLLYFLFSYSDRKNA
ncbi:MAG: hypothetical protein HQM10_23745 [Candidatus Riflebacteria bacterium]|nr:hypothetical protein [Candidatus Riflebacteria bacterium]